MINERADYTILCNHSALGLHVKIPTELVKSFKLLIHRALNTNADCHPAFKEFGDLLEHGKVLQDYYSQRSDIKSGRSVQEILLDGTSFEILPLPELDRLDKTKP